MLWHPEADILDLALRKRARHSLSVALLLLELPLAPLRLLNLPSVVLENSFVARINVGALGRLADDERIRRHRGDHLERQVWLRRWPPQLAGRVGRGDAQVLRKCRCAAANACLPSLPRRVGASRRASPLAGPHRWRRLGSPRCAAAGRFPDQARRSAARVLAASERLSASVRFRAVTGRPSRQLPRLGCARSGH